MDPDPESLKFYSSDGTPSEETGIHVTFRETQNQTVNGNSDEFTWKALIDGLPEFDEDGFQYEYIIVEMDGDTAYVPTHTVTRDETTGNYETEVINGPGPGTTIFVQKKWIDDSDNSHHEPVTINVYEKGTKDLLGTTVLNSES